MNNWNKKVVREQLDKKIEPLRIAAFNGIPQQGWAKTIREALGLSTLQLGKKVGLDQSRISRLENAEKNGNLKLSSLQKIAKGLNMKFVYGFVPDGPLEEMVRAQAKKGCYKKIENFEYHHAFRETKPVK